MPEQPLRNVRVLIVEDDPQQLKGLKDDLDMIDENQRRLWGIDTFQSSLASSVEEATDLLAAADSPYDILILDLGLPLRKDEPPAPPENGQRFLEGLSKKAVKEVIIVSSFSDYDNVMKAVRRGAVDFIAKTYRTELLQTRVMESWKRVLEKDSDQLLQERIKELVHYNERGLAYGHTVCFNDFADYVLYKTRDLEQLLYKRYGLNKKRDEPDPLMQILLGFEASVQAAKQEWMKLRVPSLPEEETHNVEAVESLLGELEQSLLPCLIVKRLRLEVHASGEIKVLTFQNDVRAVLKEILCGALAESSDYDSPRDEQEPSDTGFSNLIRIAISSRDGQARVTFADNLRPISNDDAEQINTGSLTVAGERFSRAWGLAVMQQIAILGGGRLEVEPQRQGNQITFLIPLDHDA